MPSKNRLQSFNEYLNLYRCAILSLVLLTACASLSAAQSETNATDKICLTCHNPVAVALQKKFLHGALKEGCLACHMDCREITPTSNRHKVPTRYLKTDEPGLCLECHPAYANDLSAVHQNQLFPDAKCSSCHEPHASNSAKRIPDFTHGPFGVRECAACHAEPLGGKVQLVAPNIEDLCNGCHLEIKAYIENAKSRHNIVSKDQSLIKSESSCVECHDAHATNQKYFLKKKELDLCNRCHLNITAGMKYVHDPVQVSCLFCHDAHASNIPNDLHAPVHELCLSCHGENADRIKFISEPVLLFEGRVRLQQDSFERMKPLRLSRDGKDHPTDGHPVYVPAEGNKPELNCLSCHDAHANPSSPELLKESAQYICLRCHER